MIENKNEIPNSLECDLSRKVVPVEETMSDGELWEWNLLHGIGNDIY